MVPLTLAGLFLLGILAGSGINYLADVLPYTRTFSHPACPVCQEALPWRGYWLLRPCPSCQRRRGIRAWVVLILVTAGVLALALVPGLTQRLGFWPSLVLLLYFALVALIDFEYRLIMHPTSLVGAFICAIIGVWQHGWLSTLLGGAAGFSTMLMLYWFGGVFTRFLMRMRGQQTDEVALGFGDVNLSGILGLLLGWPGVIAGLLVAILLGGLGSLIVLVVMVLRRRFQAFTAIPYGPFLVLSAALLIFR